MTPDPEWPVTFFDDDYLRIYRTSFTPEKTATEVEFIASVLGLQPGAPVLDLACGLGRHAIGMAKLGYKVTGVDFNPRYLEIAAEQAKLVGANVRWVHADMRALPFSGEFEGAYSFFTSFGYFSDTENEAVLGEIARSLRTPGVLLLDLAHRDWILTHPRQRTWDQREDGSLVVEEVSFDLRTSRVTSRMTMIADTGPRVIKEFDLRTYTCAELESMLRRQGFAVRSVWGGADRSSYSTESRRLVMLAGRPG